MQAMYVYDEKDSKKSISAHANIRSTYQYMPQPVHEF